MIGNTNLSRAVDTKSRETLLRLASLTRDLSSNDDRCRGNAYRDLLELAEEGSSDAMFQVARCLNQGIGVEVDQVKSDHWLRLACVTNPPRRSPSTHLACRTFFANDPMRTPCSVSISSSVLPLRDT